jgi:hypothetical protein
VSALVLRTSDNCFERIPYYFLNVVSYVTRVTMNIHECHNYEGEPVQRSQMESKAAVMDIIGFLCA